MKQILALSVLVLSGNVLADSVSSATGTFSSFASGFAASTPGWNGALTPLTSAQSPFWNNPSDDVGVGGSHMMNVGDVLTDSGGLAGTTSVLGADSVTEQFADAGGVDPTAFSFTSSGGPTQITMLFAQSSLDTGNPVQGTIFGYYVGGTYTVLYDVGDTSSPTGTMEFDAGGGSYGFYATVCYGGGFCETYTTGSGNTGDEPDGAGWNHFALFQLASGGFAMGFTAADAVVGEGIGDFNDVVVEFQGIPEPGTIGIMAIGLAGLGLAARKIRAAR